MKHMIAKGQVVALVPARGGSKGVPRKNIKLLHGFPLLAYSLVAARLSSRISRAIVSTDDEEIAAVAKKFGGEVPFMRPSELAKDTSGDTEVVLHALHWLQENEGCVPEYIVHLRPTTPLRIPALVDEAIQKLMGNSPCTSLRSAHPAPESPCKWFRLERDVFKSFVPGMSNDDLNRDRRAFDEAYIPDGYVDVLRTEYILESGSLHGDRMMAYLSPCCTEVDTQEEFERLEYELERKGSKLYDYLRDQYKEFAGVERDG